MKSKPETSGNLDRYDIKILAALSADGRLTLGELAKIVGLSKSPCQVRMKRLQEERYILGYRAVLNPVKLGRDHIAFVEVRLTDTTEPALDAFNSAVMAVPEIEQCHMIAGSFDYLLKIRTTGIRSYRQVLGATISNLPNVGSTSTHVAMQSVKDDSY
ncbi:MAG: Lrp/AsnC ligand binding domain-containing protein [Rhodobacteraceae bacterium]|nr:Lrp/AsnC ligand binding domain-containing protein [Paracoccaceae bacterium]